MPVAELGRVQDNGVVPSGKRFIFGIIASRRWAVEELAASAGF